MPSLNTGNAILSNAIAVNSSYNVGIGGAASGTFKLEVTGTSNLTGALTGTSAALTSTLSAMATNIQFNLDGTFGANYYTMGFGGVSNGFNRIAAGTGTTDGLYIMSATGRDIAFRTNGSGTTSMLITSGGQVGIGTTSIDSSVSVDIQNRSASSNNVLLRVKNTSANEDVGFVINGINGGVEYDYKIGINTIANTSDLTFSTAQASGYRWYTSSAEVMRITSGGNVGIGTTDPSGAKLRVEGGELRVTTSNAGIALYYAATYGEVASYNWGTGAWLQQRYNALSHAWYLSGGASAAMTIASNGNVGIGGGDSIVKLNIVGAGASSSTFALYATNSTPNALFFVRNDGYMYFGLEANSPYNIAQSGRTCILASNGSVGYLSSTRESKTNIENLSDISWLYQLNPVSFNYRKKDDDNNYTNEAENEKWYGLIADEAESVNEDLVFYNTKEDGTKQLAGVEYNKLVAALIKSVQELNQKINEQQQTINSLINR